MSYQNDDFDNTWTDLPEQPADQGRWVTWLVTGGVILAMVCLCGAAGFLVVREVLATPEPPASPIIPTDPASTPEIVIDSTLPLPPTPIISETPALAPTSTTPPQVTEVQIPPNSVEAIRLTSAPVIDGSLTEWPGSPTTFSSFRVYSVAGWDGTDDLQARWQLAWDTSNLYVAVQVTDDVHVQNQSGNQIFRGDSVDMQFDTDRLGDLSDELSPDDIQITLSPGDFAALSPSAFRFQGTENGRIVDAVGGNQVMVSAQKTGDGYTLEASIPWSDLALTPIENLVIGLALNANDNDSDGTAVQEVMMSHVASRTLTDPSSWGSLVLR